MRLIKVVKLMVILTSLALIYTHLQMQIFELAYQGKVKEGKIRNLRDENGAFTYKVLSLKSSANLGVRLLEDKTGMQFLDNNQVIKIVTTKGPLDQNAHLSQVNTSKNQKENPLLSLFSLRSQAEAKQIEQSKTKGGR